jgi:uncharacterized membrane protein
MKKISLLVLSFFVPVFAFAQSTDAFSILVVLGRIISWLIPLAITAGVLYFIWGVIKYITAKDEEKQTEARSTMISGIIGLFVIISIWGLVRVVQKTFDIEGAGSQLDLQQDIPCVPGTPGANNC